MTEKSEKWSIFFAGFIVGMFLIILMYDLRGLRPEAYVRRAVEARYAHYDEEGDLVWDDPRARYVVTGQGAVDARKR